MGKKSGGGAAVRSAGAAVPRGRVRGGGGGTAADAGPGAATGSAYAGAVLYAWSKLGKYVVRPIARALYGNQKKYKLNGVRVGRRAYQQAMRQRRADARAALGNVTAAAATRPADPGYRPDLTERRLPPLKRPPPPPPPRGPSRIPKLPQLPPGSIRGGIVAYVVANGIIWGVNKAGEWIFQRMATTEEIATGRTQGGGPRRGGPRASSWRKLPEPLTPIEIFAKRMPVPKQPARTIPRQPVTKQPGQSPALEPIVITAAKLPMPIPATPTPAWKKALQLLPPGSNPLSLFKGKKASKSARQLGRALTALETRGVTSTATSSYFSGFGGGSTPTRTKQCECKPKRKKPKQPRTICYTGTYTERADGLTKLKRRKIPCRSSQKKSA